MLHFPHAVQLGISEHRYTAALLHALQNLTGPVRASDAVLQLLKQHCCDTHPADLNVYTTTLDRCRAPKTPKVRQPPKKRQRAIIPALAFTKQGHIFTFALHFMIRVLNEHCLFLNQLFYYVIYNVCNKNSAKQ